MEILHYTINLEKLLETQAKATEQNSIEKERIKNEGLQNKKELLKYALPFYHGVLALHNNKCRHTSSTSTGRQGLLGLSKVDIQEKLDFIANTDSHHIWGNNYQSITLSVGSRYIKIWLNKRRGCHVATPHLPYSMTSFNGNQNSPYGNSIEEELEEIARFCAVYTEEW